MPDQKPEVLDQPEMWIFWFSVMEMKVTSDLTGNVLMLPGGMLDVSVMY